MIAAVRETSNRFVPSEINWNTNRLSASVPVASVPVLLKPVPNVTVLESAPEVITIT